MRSSIFDFLRLTIEESLGQASDGLCDLYSGKFGRILWLLENERNLSENDLKKVFDYVIDEVSRCQKLGTFYWGQLSSVPLMLVEKKKFGICNHGELISILMASLDVNLAQTRRYELMGGYAGLLWGLEGLRQLSSGVDFDGLCSAVFRRILTGGKTYKSGVYFDLPQHALRPLTGFSHGTAGIGYTIEKFSGQSKTKPVIELMERILANEIGDSGEVSPDYRNVNLDRAFWAWCHGPIGSSIFYARNVEHNDVLDATIRKYLDFIRRNVDLLEKMSISLCHGLVGNFCILRRMAEVTGSSIQELDDVYRAIKNRLWTNVEGRITRNDKDCLGYFHGCLGAVTWIDKVTENTDDLVLFPDSMMLSEPKVLDCSISKVADCHEIMLNGSSIETCREKIVIKRILIEGKWEVLSDLQIQYERYLDFASSSVSQGKWCVVFFDGSICVNVGMDVFCVEYQSEDDVYYWFHRQSYNGGLGYTLKRESLSSWNRMDAQIVSFLSEEFILDVRL